MRFNDALYLLLTFKKKIKTNIFITTHMRKREIYIYKNKFCFAV